MAKMSLAAAITAMRSGKSDERVAVVQRYPMLAISSTEDILAVMNSVPAQDVERALRGPSSNGTATAVAEEVSAPKRRGRPPGAKAKVAAPPVKVKRAPVVEDDDEEIEEVIPVKRGPGRPKKSAAAPVKARKSVPVVEDDEEETPAPRKRGRPPGSGKANKPTAKVKSRKVVVEDDETEDDEIEALMTDEDDDEEEDTEDDEEESDEDDDE